MDVFVAAPQCLALSFCAARLLANNLEVFNKRCCCAAFGSVYRDQYVIVITTPLSRQLLCTCINSAPRARQQYRDRNPKVCKTLQRLKRKDFMGADLPSFLAHGGVGGDIIDIHGSSFGVFGTSDVVICQVNLSPSSQYGAGVCLGRSNDISILSMTW